MLARRAWQLGFCLCACSVFPDRAVLPEDSESGGDTGTGGSGITAGSGLSGGNATGGSRPQGGTAPFGGAPSGGRAPSGGTRPDGGAPLGGSLGSSSQAGSGGDLVDPGGTGGSDVLGGSGGSGCSVLTLVPGADAWISEAAPKANFGKEMSLQVGSLEQDRAEALLSFDLKEVPAGSQVEKAELELELRTSAGGDRRLSVYRVSQEWNEAQVSWARARSGRGWESGGGADVIEPPSASRDLPLGTAARTRISFDVTADVSDMLDFPMSNLGWAIREERQDAARLELSASEVEDSTPALVVTTCP
jgi:hypothetical protein